eukprot:5974571-Amphidinium_carterae.4
MEKNCESLDQGHYTHVPQPPGNPKGKDDKGKGSGKDKKGKDKKGKDKKDQGEITHATRKEKGKARTKVNPRARGNVHKAGWVEDDFAGVDPQYDATEETEEYDDYKEGTTDPEELSVTPGHPQHTLHPLRREETELALRIHLRVAKSTLTRALMYQQIIYAKNVPRLLVLTYGTRCLAYQSHTSNFLKRLIEVLTTWTLGNNVWPRSDWERSLGHPLQALNEKRAHDDDASDKQDSGSPYDPALLTIKQLADPEKSILALQVAHEIPKQPTRTNVSTED